jgi:II/X family phage/plasmid replication protein
MKALMIDWATIKIKFRHKPLDAGRITSINADGTVEFDICKKISIRGTYESNTLLRSSGDLDKDGYCSDLLIDGNPSKFLQGQNIFGTDDINLLVVKWFQSICHELNMFYSPFDSYRLSRGDYEINRVDINGMFKMNHQADVIAYLIALGQSGGTKYQRAYYQKGSVYFNKGSRRYSIVFYSKHEEIKSRKKGHRLEFNSELKTKLFELSKGLIRIEARILSLELKDRNILTGGDLVQYGIDKLYGEFMKKIQINGNMRISDEKASQMPSKLRGTYELWLSGLDLRSMMSRSTFFAHKKLLKSDYGIDIDSGERETGSNVVSLNRVLELEPMEIPSFIFESNLIVFKRAA